MRYELYNDDCMFLKTDLVDLVYLDPPYSNKKEDEYYGVGETFEDFLYYMESRLGHIKGLMKPDANILVHMDYKAIHYIKVAMDEIFGRENFKNEIIWCFSNPASVKRWLPRKHNTILWYGMGNYVFNPPRIPYKTKMNVGGDAAWSKEKIPWEHYEKKGKLLEDWWIDIPTLCRNEPEKTGYATQKPFKLMERIVEVFSSPGDRVLDPFCGSGSTLEAAILRDRFPIGCDKNEEAIKVVKKRLDAMKEGNIYMD